MNHALDRLQSGGLAPGKADWEVHATSDCLVTAAPFGLTRLLRDRYAFEGELGSGGMATVYLARDLQDGSQVAVKVLRPDLIPTLGGDRFAREIRITSRLHHPNILPVLDSGQGEDGVPFYVTPYVEGESLAKRLLREGQIPIPDAIDIACQVADALEAAHSQGFIHRDIKPSNILLSNGRVFVADFGIARAVDVVTAEKLTESGMALGTPTYMSPEQSACGSLDARTDIYSLGCVLFEMLAGSPPFVGPSAQSVRARHALDPPPNLRTVRNTVSPSLERVIDKALAKVPADRFPTATAFAEALVEGRTGMSLWERVRTLRHKAFAASLALAAGVGIWVASGSMTATLDGNKVVVFPLFQRAGSALRPGLGEEVALLIGSALEHSEPLKWIDGWTWLDVQRRNNIGLLDARTARDIARARRARFYIDGAVIGTADTSTVILRLNDARGDSLIAQASTAGGSRTAVAQLGLTAISELLPRLLAPGRQVDFAPLSDRRPAAIASWLQGEREYRQSQFLRALEYYQRAVREDSAFSIAALNGAQAADWMAFDEDARSLVSVALGHEENLPPKYAHLAHGLEYFLIGSADSAVSRYRQALRIDPAWAEAWTALGDVYYHLLPAEVPLDSLSEAAFAEAMRADPEFLPPIFHLVEIALRRKDLPRANVLLADFHRSNPDSTWTVQLELMSSCRQRGAAAIDWRTQVAEHSEEVFYTAKALAAAGADWSCSEAGLRELLRSDSIAGNFQRASLLILQSILVAQGRYGEAARLIDSAVAGRVEGASGLYVLDAVAGAPFEQQAAAVLESLGEGTRTLQAPRQWFKGSWYGHTGDVPRLMAAVETLGQRARSTEKTEDSLLAEAMLARLELARGDSALAKQRLLALQPTAIRRYITWGLWQSLAAERMSLAEILLAQDDPSRAIDVASGFDHPEPVVYLLYWPRSLALRYRAAIRLGRTDLAERYAARLREIGRQDLLESTSLNTSSRSAP